LADIRPEDVETVTAEGLLIGKPSDFFTCFIHKSDLAVIVRCKNAIGNAVKNHVKKLIGLFSFHENL
jgi:hypothetical protein